MKKLYMAAIAMAFFGQAGAQILNQSAGWPNAAWTITGNYSTDPLAFEADPRTTANFAFDDDDAGSGGHEDNIAAESPVIDLTAAFNGGEKSLVVNVQYGYYYLANDVLQFQWWNAAASAWVPWPGANIPGNNTSVTDNFCAIPKTQYTTEALSIANFSPAQLAGFRYRISYDDDPAGADWNYGFCFDSPVITSISCGAPTGLAVTGVTPFSATFNWTEIAGIEGFQYVLDTNAADPASGTATTANSFGTQTLQPSTTYYFHLKTDCGTSESTWTTISFTTPAVPPANDACEDAVNVTTFPYTQSLDASAATNNNGLITACNGSNDGVWYTFTGAGNNVTIAMTDVVGWDPEISVYTGVCGQFTCVGTVDNGGTGGSETYTVNNAAVGIVYYVNLAHYSGFSDNPEGPFTVTITETVPPAPIANDACDTAITVTTFPYTNTQDASTATNNNGVVVVCEDDGMNDGVWYTFTGTGNNVTVALTDVQGWDPQVDVYTGVCGQFMCAGSVDAGGTSGNETLTVPTVLNTVYFINIGHYNGSTDQPEGPYTVTLAETAPPTPIANDACDTAITVTSFPYTNTQDASTATNNNGVVVVCEDDGMNDGVWYTFNGTGGDVTVALTGVQGWDPQLDIYTGVCGQFMCAGSVDNGGTSGNETLTVTTAVGTTYFINVGHYNGFSDQPEGPYTILIEGTLASKAFNNAAFQYYPNPVKNTLNVSYDQNIDNIEVYNLVGQRVLVKTLGAKEAKVDVSGLAQGQYIAKLTSGNQVQAIKIIKE